MDLSSLGISPVNKDNPAGQDVKYDPDFEKLQAEIGKLVSVGTADWKKIAKLASGILEHKSKDLFSASYLAVALIYLDKTEGLLTGLGIYHNLLTHFWDDLFPSKERMRGRISAVEWWIERTEAALSQPDLYAADPETMDNIRETLDNIDKFLVSNLEDPPSLFGILKKLNTMTALVTDEEKDNPPLPEGKTHPEEKELPESENDISIDISNDELEKIFSEYYIKIRKTAFLLRKKDLSDPRAYSQNRIASWSLLNSLPPDEKKFTKIHSPEANLKNHIQTLVDKENWELLLEIAEQEIGRFVFWLDLNYYSVQALEMLGQDFNDAHKAVCSETAFFIHRLPGLEDFLFSDGTPFADDNTKEWLKTIALGKSIKEKKKIVIPASLPLADKIEDQIKEIKKYASENTKADVLRYIQAGIQKSVSMKESFKWRIILSIFLLEWKEYELALPHLKKILKIIDTYSLELWNPAIAVRGLKTVFSGFALYSDNKYMEKSAEILQRIAVIDPAKAYAFKSDYKTINKK